ncbi:hypothetical protein T01_4342 [Trichinella spiralis]|uniref:Uncharacterized protein n=1 Tax=Trichinella spiralis TaxID=6334 RepID=A0A0V1BS52_TRISP|nr:hypothetical protein T01_4342 [Trichinella spiralis]
MNTDVNVPVITVDEIEVIKNGFDRTEGTTDSYTGTLRYVVVTPEVFLPEFVEVIDLCCGGCNHDAVVEGVLNCSNRLKRRHQQGVQQWSTTFVCLS